MLLAVGRFRRLAALALIASIVPTTYAAHRFWRRTTTSYGPTSRCTSSRTSASWAASSSPPSTRRVSPPSAGGPTPGGGIGAAVAVGRAAGSSSARSTGSSVADSAGELARHARDAAVEVGRHLDDGAGRAPTRPRTWPPGSPGRPTSPVGRSPAPCPARDSSSPAPSAGPEHGGRDRLPGRPLGGTVTPLFAAGADQVGERSTGPRSPSRVEEHGRPDAGRHGSRRRPRRADRISVRPPTPGGWSAARCPSPAPRRPRRPGRQPPARRRTAPLRARRRARRCPSRRCPFGSGRPSSPVRPCQTRRKTDRATSPPPIR